MAHFLVNWRMNHFRERTKKVDVYSKSTGLQECPVADAVAWQVGELSTLGPFGESSDGGGAAVLGSDFAERSFGDVGALLGVHQLVLHLAVLGEVHGGDLLGLLDLALVGLDLGLELLNEILHALHVFAVLLGLESEFLEPSVGFAEVLGGFLVAALLGVELGLQLADAGLELGDDALASLESGGLGLVEASLELGDGDLELAV